MDGMHRRLHLSTAQRAPKIAPLHSRLPLPIRTRAVVSLRIEGRNSAIVPHVNIHHLKLAALTSALPQWTNLCIDLASITSSCFKGITFRSVDSISIGMQGWGGGRFSTPRRIHHLVVPHGRNHLQAEKGVYAAQRAIRLCQRFDVHLFLEEGALAWYIWLFSHPPPLPCSPTSGDRGASGCEDIPAKVNFPLEAGATTQVLQSEDVVTEESIAGLSLLCFVVVGT